MNGFGWYSYASQFGAPAPILLAGRIRHESSSTEKSQLCRNEKGVRSRKCVRKQESNEVTERVRR